MSNIFYTFDFGLAGDRLIEIYAAVPEPSSLVLMLAGLAVLLARSHAKPGVPRSSPA